MRRTKGEVEWLSLEDLAGPDYAGMKVGVRHEGPGLARTWQLRMRAIQLAETRRLATLRKGLTREDAPDLWPESGGLVTPEGLGEALGLTRDVVRAVLADTEGLPAHEDAVVELERIGALHYLLQPIMEVQQLTRAQFPAAETARDTETGGPPPATDGSGPAGGAGG